MADHVHAVFRVEGLPCGAGVYSGGRLHIWIWPLVGDVSVCVAPSGIDCLEVPEGGVPLVLECCVRDFWTVLWPAVFHPLCLDRGSRRAAAGAVCRVQLVGGGNSVGYRPLCRELRFDACSVQTSAVNYEQDKIM